MNNLHRLHPCTDHNCIFRGPSFIPDKPMKETIQQFNVKNGSCPTSSIKNSSFKKDSPVSPHLPHVQQTVSFDLTPNHIPPDDSSVYEDTVEHLDEQNDLQSPDESDLPTSSEEPFTPLISSLASSTSTPSNSFSHVPYEDTSFINDPSDSYNLRL